MSILKDKTKAIAIMLILMFAMSTPLAILPIGSAAINVTETTAVNEFIGLNSETLIIFTFNPNIFDSQTGDPELINKATAWANATATFTRPDNTTDIVNGPFIVRPDVIGGEAGRLYLYYTPNQSGWWTVTFDYPGDDKYNPISSDYDFYVGTQPIPKRDVWAMLAIRPYPNVGLGQDILINAWLTPPPYTDRQNYQDYKFTFKRPDGTSYVVGPMDSEGPATVWFNLPLDQLGNWSITMDFPGDYGSKAATITRYINVVDEWVPSYPDTPLPTEPWSFPINIENRQWRTIAGPWFDSSYNASLGSFNPYTEGPRTAHILWKIPAYSGIGGFIGSPFGIRSSTGVAEYGQERQGIATSSCYSFNTIMMGRGYASAGGNITCIDIHTGEILWSESGSFDLGDFRGSTPVLYDFSSSRMVVYDAISGNVLTDVPGISVNFVEYPYAYSWVSTENELGNIIKWDISSTTSNFNNRIQWNVTNFLPSVSTSHSLLVDGFWIARHFWGLGEVAPSTSNAIIVDYITAMNLTDGSLGWNVTTCNRNDPSTYVYRQGPAWGSGEGLVYFAGFGDINEGLGYVAYHTDGSGLAWWSPPTDYPWGNFWAYTPQASGYGQVYGLGYSGIWAFNASTGEINWHYIDPDIYGEEPYESDIVGQTVPNNLGLVAGDSYASYGYGSTGPIIGGGVLYAVTSEHSPTFYYRGQGMSAVDVYTGEGLFHILGVYSLGGIAEGVLTMSDSRNGYTYGWGKGATETTVVPSAKVVAKGGSVLLEGTVLDMSPAQPGTAAVSDDSQEGWMEYLHMQQVYPFSAQGVAVSLDALDPNNNYVHIGDVTSDLTGKYSFLWEPELEGKYTVIASFYSTDAYYGSTAEAAVGVTAGPVATAEPTPTPASNTDMYILSIGAAAIVAIVIFGLAIIILLMRRR
jgi:hypothetical protein